MIAYSAVATYLVVVHQPFACLVLCVQDSGLIILGSSYRIKPDLECSVFSVSAALQERLVPVCCTGFET